MSLERFMTAAEQSVMNERAKQRLEYDEAHDDRHAPGEFAEEAARFARNEPRLMCNPKDRPRRERLVIAAALLIAEIEKLDRAKVKYAPLDVNAAVANGDAR